MDSGYFEAHVSAGTEICIDKVDDNKMTISLYLDSMLMVSTNDRSDSLTGTPNITSVYFRRDVVATKRLAYKIASIKEIDLLSG